MPYADPEVNKAKSRARYAAHREEDKARRKAAYYAADKAIERAKRRAWYDANRDKALRYERGRQYRLKYGITIEQYDAMLAIQDGRWKVCGTVTPGRRTQYFSVDHDHVTGKVRGLLCVKCNWRLGWFEAHREAVLLYLETA